MSLFLIIGKNDNPLFRALLGSKRDEESDMSEFVLHAALDIVEDKVWQTSSPYLKCVDKYGSQYISAYVTPSHTTFLLLHDKKDEDGIRTFFTEVHQLFIRILMNPFYSLNTPIRSSAFETRVRQLGKKL